MCVWCIIFVVDFCDITVDHTHRKKRPRVPRAVPSFSEHRNSVLLRCAMQNEAYIARHARYARRASCSRACACAIAAHRARHHRPPSPMSPMRARGGSGGGAVSFARLLARAEAEAVGLGEAVGYIARHACQTCHARRSSRARTRISSPLRARHRRFPSSPRTTGTRALLRRRRSLARSIARTRCGVGGGGGVQLHRASHAPRARAWTSPPRIARVITVPLPPTRPHARAATAAALARSIALARCGDGSGGRSFARRACLTRHAHACARHPRHGTC